MLRPASRLVAFVGWVAAASFLCSCAHNRNHPVSIDSRPTPVQPEAARDTVVAPAPPKSEPRPTNSASQAAADTLAARNALNRCAGRKLLPEQESTVDSVSDALARARDALARGDLTAGASYAREARQLSRSLGCP